ncbi:lead, cadmium, zinc and mercury transporting ATPase [Candidatus Termititenax aidoneus]|uniref:Lead, cadmium, zinc and mercury transporting ATPase n=1 Tax=Termititenax aidoneus TaxID=2218524 RepID=A0A388T9C6_TERA1|nr:lead, cadmium, zinc and mercury transporting ATPase [Candidatus Termititenax aidoneus]
MCEACACGAKKPEKSAKLKYFCLFGGAVFFLAGLFLKLDATARLLVFLASYILIGGEVVWQAVKNIPRGHIFDENFLMSLASIGAFAIGEYPEAAAVMLFYQIGESFQERAVARSRQAITALMDIRPDFAVLPGGEKVDPADVKVGAVIIVRPGEKIPLDGAVIEGNSALDMTALTGESLPRDVSAGSEVLSGSVNQSGLLTIRVDKVFGESTVSKILRLVENAEQKKAPVENFITKFARYYTPAVVGAAVLLAVLPPLLISGAVFTNWLYRALTFLVVSCPCALVVSIPLSFFAGIGAASQNGILIKGGNYLDALNDASTVVFDKTGTLTKGVFSVTQILPADGWTAEKLLETAAHAELHSNHPIAVSIRKAYGKNPDSARLTQYAEIAGQGIKIKFDGKIVLAGNAKMFAAEKVSLPDSVFSNPPDGTVIYLAVNQKFAGALVIADEIKPDSQQAIAGLNKLGLRDIVMLTGDNKNSARKIAAALGIPKVYAELLPQEKVERLEALSQSGGKTIFVGDGINDAPVLAASDVGVAMGGVGSDAAIEAADIVLMTDEPSKLSAALRIARLTRRIVWQNIIFALGVKAAILLLSALGRAGMWFAVFGDVGVCFLAILNALRIMLVKPLKD